jgi:hypothetical protein
LAHSGRLPYIYVVLETLATACYCFGIKSVAVGPTLEITPPHPLISGSSDIHARPCLLWPASACHTVMLWFPMLQGGCCKVHPKNRPRRPRGGGYSSTLSLTLALDRGGWSAPQPWPLYHQGKRSGTHCIGGWMGPRAGLNRCGKSRPHRDSIPGPSSP